MVADDGTPIANAAVELWAGTRRVLTLSTREDGLAFAQRKKLPSLTSVVCAGDRLSGRLGPGGPQRTRSRYGSRKVVPRIPDIVVEALPRYECREDEPAARGVWQAATMRYTLLPTERRYWAVGRGTAGNGDPLESLVARQLGHDALGSEWPGPGANLPVHPRLGLRDPPEAGTIGRHHRHQRHRPLVVPEAPAPGTPTTSPGRSSASSMRSTPFRRARPDGPSGSAPGAPRVPALRA